jgi:hypothetical protein
VTGSHRTGHQTLNRQSALTPASDPAVGLYHRPSLAPGAAGERRQAPTFSRDRAVAAFLRSACRQRPAAAKWYSRGSISAERAARTNATPAFRRRAIVGGRLDRCTRKTAGQRGALRRTDDADSPRLASPSTCPEAESGLSRADATTWISRRPSERRVPADETAAATQSGHPPQ